MNIEESKKFMDELVGIMKNRFPKSNIYWHRRNIFGVTDYIVSFYLAETIDECANKISMNDAMNWCFSIENCDDKGCLFDNLIINLNRNTICRTADKNDPSEKYCVYGRVKVPYRKIKGDAKSCLDKMRKFIDKVAEIMLANAATINEGTIKGYFKVEDKVR